MMFPARKGREEMKMVFRYILIAVLLTGATVSRAGSIWLTPAYQEVFPGGGAILDLNMDFTDDPTLGGAVDIFYDVTRLGLVSFEFNPALGDDPSFRNSPDELPGELNALNIGNFGGMSGPAVIGTLMFQAWPDAPVGPAALIVADSDDPLWGAGFFSSDTYEAQVVGYAGATVNVVPEMEVWAMMVVGMGLLGWQARRKKTA